MNSSQIDQKMENSDIIGSISDQSQYDSDAGYYDEVDEALKSNEEQNFKDRYENATEVSLEGLSDSIKMLINN